SESNPQRSALRDKDEVWLFPVAALVQIVAGVGVDDPHPGTATGIVRSAETQRRHPNQSSLHSGDPGLPRHRPLQGGVPDRALGLRGVNARDRRAQEALDRSAGRQPLFELVVHQELRGHARNLLGEQILRAGHQAELRMGSPDAGDRIDRAIEQMVEDENLRTGLILGFGAADDEQAVAVYTSRHRAQPDRVMLLGVDLLELDLVDRRGALEIVTTRHPLTLGGKARVAIDLDALQLADEGYLAHRRNARAGVGLRRNTRIGEAARTWHLPILEALAGAPVGRQAVHCAPGERLITRKEDVEIDLDPAWLTAAEYAIFLAIEAAVADRAGVVAARVAVDVETVRRGRLRRLVGKLHDRVAVHIHDDLRPYEHRRAGVRVGYGLRHRRKSQPHRRGSPQETEGFRRQHRHSPSLD